MKSKAQRRKTIRHRIRKSITGTGSKPRMSVFKSNKSIYCQLIDDAAGVTLASASSLNSKSKGKIDQAKEVGKAIAEIAKGKDISDVIFDRSGFIYHGRIKALADSAREAGLKF